MGRAARAEPPLPVSPQPNRKLCRLRRTMQTSARRVILKRASFCAEAQNSAPLKSASFDPFLGEARKGRYSVFRDSPAQNFSTAPVECGEILCGKLREKIFPHSCIKKLWKSSSFHTRGCGENFVAALRQNRVIHITLY